MAKEPAITDKENYLKNRNVILNDLKKHLSEVKDNKETVFEDINFTSE